MTLSFKLQPILFSLSLIGAAVFALLTLMSVPLVANLSAAVFSNTPLPVATTGEMLQINYAYGTAALLFTASCALYLLGITDESNTNQDERGNTR